MDKNARNLLYFENGTGVCLFKQALSQIPVRFGLPTPPTISYAPPLQIAAAANARKRRTFTALIEKQSGNNVALGFVGAATDRGRAVVEIFQRRNRLPPFARDEAVVVRTVARNGAMSASGRG
jgi:hypothetical protein